MLPKQGHMSSNPQQPHKKLVMAVHVFVCQGGSSRVRNYSTVAYKTGGTWRLMAASLPTSDSEQSSDLRDLGECDRCSVSSSVLCMHVYIIYIHTHTPHKIKINSLIEYIKDIRAKYSSG